VTQRDEWPTNGPGRVHTPNRMELHVVFGSGQVGAPLVEVLLAKGHRVRVVKRTRSDVAAGAELVTGDAFDRAFCVRNAVGATAVYPRAVPARTSRSRRHPARDRDLGDRDVRAARPDSTGRIACVSAATRASEVGSR
jgi:uncharacterized protein YbjT (DUF2867 family)